MAKDNRVIHSGVRHEGTTYTAGMEDELAAAAGQKLLNRLAKKGAISGNWSSSAKVAPVEVADDDDFNDDDENEEVEDAEVEAAPAKKSASKKSSSKKSASKKSAK
jgi:hypothetical protein